MYDLVLKNVRLPKIEEQYYIGIENEFIAEISRTPIKGKEEIDGCGDLVMPPFVETHIHLDTVYTAGEPRWNQSGSLFEGISIWNERKQMLTEDDVYNRAIKALCQLLKHGVLYVRAIVDISDERLTALKALLKVKEDFSTILNLQIIAFPQNGLISFPENKKRMIEAIKLGVDGISAVPHLERTREEGIESIKFCFSLAEKYNTFIHIFCDEIDDSQSRFVETVASYAITSGLKEKVTACHTCAMVYYPDSYASKLLDLISISKINIVSCPLINTVMQGRYDSYPKGRGVTRIKEMIQKHINVCIAHDDIMTPFYPLGSGNILQAAHMAVHAGHLTGSDELEEIINMISINGARTLQIADSYGIKKGNEANLITFSVQNTIDLIRYQPHCRYVISKGKVMAHTPPSKTIFYRTIQN
ncbi:cytosine deaminase [Bacillus methanolicus PB1]|uniref:Cytosine deaminase n=1 Tax=Bacillus methanolicus PB1 TaxID=997296 RepID=I3E1Q5_BACMT|nr:cytosine deaminase [Bacillus methanolicus]EIJ80426.1 cytosine deaminase [Bacillus methanolicus PB1]